MDENEPINDSSKRATIAIVASVVVVAAIVAIVLLTPKTSPGPSNSTNSNTQNTSTNETAGVATITFTNDGFSPATLSVKTGTIVTVENKSSNPVQFSSSDHPTHHDNPELNMAKLAPGESGTFTATTVGTQSYHDHIDDSKVGTLVVTK